MAREGEREGIKEENPVSQEKAEQLTSPGKIRKAFTKHVILSSWEVII